MENVRKFNIQALLVIGGFEVRGEPLPRAGEGRALKAPHGVTRGRWHLLRLCMGTPRRDGTNPGQRGGLGPC